MLGPFVLLRDSRDGTVYRVAADAQSKIVTSGSALFIDQLFLKKHGYDAAIDDADHEFVYAWLDSVPRVG